MFEVNGRVRAFWNWALIGIALVLIGWGCWIWIWDPGILLRVLMLSLISSGAAMIVMGVWKALDRRPVLVVDGEGLLDRTGWPTRRMVWSEISGCRLVAATGRSPRWLAIDLVDPAQFIAKAMPGSGALLESFEKQYGTPCVIALRTLDIEPHYLLERLKAVLRQR